MTARRYGLFAAALLLSTASSGVAQVGVTPTMGAFIPASDLRGLQEGAEQVRVDREGTLGLGLNIDAGWLRGTIAYATGAILTERGVGNRGEIGDGTILAAAADLVLRPLPRLIVQPYLLGGAGVKRQDYSWDDDGLSDPFPRDRTDFTLHFGVGADVMLGRIGLVAEVSDFLSRDAADDFRQHDAFAMVGLRIRF